MWWPKTFSPISWRPPASARERHLANVSFVKGTEADPHLADDSVDVILALDSYHHYNYPEKMLAAFTGPARRRTADHSRILQAPQCYEGQRCREAHSARRTRPGPRGREATASARSPNTSTSRTASTWPSSSGGNFSGPPGPAGRWRAPVCTLRAASVPVWRSGRRTRLPPRR